MKKFLSAAAAAAIVCGAVSVPAFAEDSAMVYVSISDPEQRLVMSEIEVTDVDGDGALTINDTLVITHEQFGATFETMDSDYGPFITTLWDVTNGGSYGYYLNNTMSMGLTDPVKDGDTLYAYVYSDTETFSDTYSFFDKNIIRTEVGNAVELTLCSVAFDENWAPYNAPVANAYITVNGEKTTAKTDENGQVTISFHGDGLFYVSAVSDEMTLVPPALKVVVDDYVPAAGETEGAVDGASDKGSPDTGAADVAVFAGAALLAAGAFAVAKRRK